MPHATETRTICLFSKICRHSASKCRVIPVGGGATGFASGTYAENVPFSMRSKDHVTGIGVRRIELESSFPILTPPSTWGSRDRRRYDLLNKHLFELT